MNKSGIRVSGFVAGTSEKVGAVSNEVGTDLAVPGRIIIKRDPMAARAAAPTKCRFISVRLPRKAVIVSETFLPSRCNWASSNATRWGKNETLFRSLLQLLTNLRR